MYKVMLKEKNVIDLSADANAAHLQESQNTIQTRSIRYQGSESVGSNHVSETTRPGRRLRAQLKPLGCVGN